MKLKRMFMVALGVVAVVAIPCVVASASTVEMRLVDSVVIDDSGFNWTTYSGTLNLIGSSPIADVGIDTPNTVWDSLSVSGTINIVNFASAGGVITVDDNAGGLYTATLLPGPINGGLFFAGNGEWGFGVNSTGVFNGSQFAGLSVTSGLDMDGFVRDLAFSSSPFGNKVTDLWVTVVDPGAGQEPSVPLPAAFLPGMILLGLIGVVQSRRRSG